MKNKLKLPWLPLAVGSKAFLGLTHLEPTHRTKKPNKKNKVYSLLYNSWEWRKKNSDKMRVLLTTRWWWCQKDGSGGGGGAAAACGHDDGEWGRCFGHTCIKDWSTVGWGWPHTCKGLKWGGWCMAVMGGNPMAATAAPPHGLISLFPPPPPPYICRLWLQLAASASRASKCFRCDLYFCQKHSEIISRPDKSCSYNFEFEVSSKYLKMASNIMASETLNSHELQYSRGHSLIHSQLLNRLHKSPVQLRSPIHLHFTHTNL